MSILYYDASMFRHVAAISGRRVQLVPVYHEAHIDTVGEPCLMRLPGVILVPQPAPKPPTAMKTACLVGVSCKEKIEICRMNEWLRSSYAVGQ